MLNISLAAEKIWTIAGFPITNALLTTWVVMAIIIVLSFLASRKIKMVPENGQLIAEFIVGGMHEIFGSVSGKFIVQFFPIVASLFLYILLSNWVGLLPGVGTIGFFYGANSTEFIPLFRGPMSDLNTTVALALVSVVAMQYFGFKNMGHHYAKRFINLKDPMMFFVGILEIVSDLAKVISFAFRLFGNIFAGEVLLIIMGFLVPYLLPLPFMILELFVGIIQAFIFAMLTLTFIRTSTLEHMSIQGKGVTETA